MSTASTLDPIPAASAGISDDPRLIEAWEALAATCGDLPTQDTPWMIAGFAAFGGKPHLLTEGDAGSLEAIAPLALHGRRLELVGANRTVEPSDLLAGSPDALAALVERVADTKRPLLLERVPAESATIPALREAAGRSGVFRQGETAGHPVIKLDERWAEPGGGLSSSRRSSLRRSRRRAEKMGEIRVEHLKPGAEELSPLLDTAFAVEARSWKSSNGTALFQVPAMAAFFRRFAAEHAARGTLRLDLLHIAGQAVAMQIGIEWRQRIWLFKIGYNDAYADASPGQLLLGESVAEAARAGLEAYELLGSRSKWTDVWTQDVRPCTRIAIYPASRQGALSLAAAGGDKLGQRAHGFVSRRLRSMERLSKSRYVAGPALTDALEQERRFAAAGYTTTIGRWGTVADKVDKVLQDAFDAVAEMRQGSQLSIKLSSMGGGRPELDELVERCSKRDIELHLDALGHETAEGALKTAIQLAAKAPGEVGCTLPARWARSAADAATVNGQPLRVRLVKGEWPDPGGFDCDIAAAYLELVEALAGRPHKVEIATQDTRLAAASMERLVTAGTPTELQVLYAMPCRAAVREARRLSVPVRVYIPYGVGRLPYSLKDVERRPRTLARFAFDLLPIVAPGPPGISPIRLGSRPYAARNSRATTTNAPSPQDT